MTTEHTLQFYARQDRLTDPARQAHLYDGLPAGSAALCEVVSGLMLHVSWAAKYGLSSELPLSRETTSVAARLAEIQARGRGPLQAPRVPAQRPAGTCRDFALMLCSLLRHHAIPARVRCGFATYFAAPRYADHWICEYWVPTAQRWARADAQLDALQREALAIDFDCADLPRDAFLTADAAWALVRSGEHAPEDFGHGDERGLWFLHVNLHRDLLALANSHTSPWDTWRQADPRSKVLSADVCDACDRLADAVTMRVTAGQVASLHELAEKHRAPPWPVAAHALHETPSA